MSEKIGKFLAERRPETPCLVVDLDVIAANFDRLAAAMPLARIYYAVKANPAPALLGVLRDRGAWFDSASIYEIDHCLSLGVAPERLSFGSTIKKEAHIAQAFERGVSLFAFDSRSELLKLSRAAPGARVFCRFLMDGAGAEWPLSRKFGCDLEMAADLLAEAGGLGLDPYGVSFHVGSQQTDPGQWDLALGRTRMLFTDLQDRGVRLRMINLGGGFPAHYRSNVPDTEDYSEAIIASVARHFGNEIPELIVEPGRGIAGDAGVIEAEVVLVSRKSYEDDTRWIYLDVGKFGGLPETMDEAIKYRVTTSRDGGPTGPCVLAGPTCDEVDVLYEHHAYDLPLDLQEGDRVRFHAAGAYTSTYASIGFNGFPPLREHYI